VRVRVERLTADGDAVTVLDGRTLAVDGALPGELVEIEEPLVPWKRNH
jgi:tRNA/tmRNA/rRNA uracil-C5-methylase (TrmA/RlmC/RlmD family)